MSILALMTHQFHPQVKRELRASHAGETGAVWIYRGILLASNIKSNPNIITFARAHLATEKAHLANYEATIHKFRGSALLIFWVFAGLALGITATLLGQRWVYYTIYKVESFVDLHYRAQIEALKGLPCDEAKSAVALFEQCNLDEIEHRDEALAYLTHHPTPSLPLLLWGQAVSHGSALAANLARII